MQAARRQETRLESALLPLPIGDAFGGATRLGSLQAAAMPAKQTSFVDNKAANGAPDEHQTKGISFEFALLPPPTGAAIGGATSLESLQAAVITADPDPSATFAVQEGSKKQQQPSQTVGGCLGSL